MKRTILAAAAGALILTGCSSPGETPAAAEPSTVTATAPAEADTGRQAGQQIQVDMYVRALNTAHANIGQPAVDEARALDFAASMCNALDAGASTYDANQILVEGGFTPEDAGEVAAKGIAAACTEHLPS